jgi:hypothetical protein
LDTGASQTLLDMQIADRLFSDVFTIWELNHGPTMGISSNDIINANRLMMITFDNPCANNVPRWEVCFTALKMDKINSAYQSVNLPPIDAILGLDFLNRFCGEIDFENFCFQLKNKK